MRLRLEARERGKMLGVVPLLTRKVIAMTAELGEAGRRRIERRRLTGHGEERDDSRRLRASRVARLERKREGGEADLLDNSAMLVEVWNDGEQRRP